MPIIRQLFRSSGPFTLLVLILAVSCARPMGSPSAPASSGTSDSPGDHTFMASLSSVVETVEQSVVRVETDLGTGTGFIFEISAGNSTGDGSTLVLTDHSVVEGADTIEVMVKDVGILPAEVQGLDLKRGLAVLRICCGEFTPLVLETNTAPVPGDPVFAMAHTQGASGPSSADPGLIIGFQSPGGIGLILTDIELVPGLSGGPLLSADGQVLGINISDHEGTYRESAGESGSFAISEWSLVSLIPRILASGDKDSKRVDKPRKSNGPESVDSRGKEQVTRQPPTPTVATVPTPDTPGATVTTIEVPSVQTVAPSATPESKSTLAATARSGGITGHLLTINGQVVGPGQAAVPVENGHVMVYPMADNSGRYNWGTLVTLGWFPATSGYGVTWEGTDTDSGSIATIRVRSDREVSTKIGQSNPQLAQTSLSSARILTQIPPTATPEYKEESISFGMYIQEFGSQGSNNKKFESPQGIAVDSSGNVYVSDTGNHRIKKYDSSGNYLDDWGSQGSNNQKFESPQGIAVDNNRKIYVADTNNHRIKKHEPGD